MKSSILQLISHEWRKHSDYACCDAADAQLVLCFASKNILSQEGIYEKVREKFPNAQVALCSTAGEIFHDHVQDDSVVAAVLKFEKTTIELAEVNISDFDNSFDAATALVKKLPRQDLTYILVLSDGAMVNGSELVKGLNYAVENRILITGGLAGDGTSFNDTLVGLNGPPAQGKIVAIGFYGNHIVVTHGSEGGWQSFGLEKIVTSSSGNKLFEVDNRNALDIYKKYLGAEAENLPSSALLFPLSVTVPGTSHPVVRTILSIGQEDNSMTFAGDIPKGSKIRFMKANFDLITAAAAVAAQNAMLKQAEKPGFSLLVSCVGRKLILGRRTEEEVEVVLESLGDKTPVAGFYSYGEISPFNEGGNCQLHNQTMTITSFYELP
jgi:hypothetical protein